MVGFYFILWNVPARTVHNVFIRESAAGSGTWLGIFKGGWRLLVSASLYSCCASPPSTSTPPPPPPPTPPRFPADAGRHQRGLLTLTRVGNRQTLEERCPGGGGSGAGPRVSSGAGPRVRSPPSVRPSEVPPPASVTSPHPPCLEGAMVPRVGCP